MRRGLRILILVVLLVYVAAIVFHQKHPHTPQSTLTPAQIVTSSRNPQALVVFRTCQFSADDAFCTKYGPSTTIDKRHLMFLCEKQRCGTLGGVDPEEPVATSASASGNAYKEPKSCSYTPSAPPAAAPSVEPSAPLPYLSLPAPATNHHP